MRFELRSRPSRVRGTGIVAVTALVALAHPLEIRAEGGKVEGSEANLAKVAAAYEDAQKALDEYLGGDQAGPSPLVEGMESLQAIGKEHPEIAAEAGTHALQLAFSAQEWDRAVEGLEWLAANAVDSPSLGHPLFMARYAFQNRAGHEESWLEELSKFAEDVARRSKSPEVQATAYGALGDMWNDEGDMERARTAYQRSLAVEGLPTDAPVRARMKGNLFEVEHLQIGMVAPEFEAPRLDGKGNVKLSDYRGKYLLVDFWAVWCGPCRAEAPSLKTIHDSFAGEKFAILGVSLDHPGTKAKLETFIEETGIRWDVTYDGKYWETPPARLYNVSGIPMTYLLDPDGKIVKKDLHTEELEEELMRLFRTDEEIEKSEATGAIRPQGSAGAR